MIYIIYIILVITGTNVTITYKIHPKSISLFLSRVGASVTPSQDYLNLLLCLHLNTGSLRSLSSSLQSLKLIILIFSSIHKLHQQLKLFAVEDCLTIFYLIWGVSSWSFGFQEYSDRAVWFLNRGLEKECLWLYSPCLQFPAEITM